MPAESPRTSRKLSALQQRLHALAARGAAQRDPVRYHYVSRMLERAAPLPPAGNDTLASKIETALQHLEQRLQSKPKVALPAPSRHSAPPLSALRSLREQLQRRAPLYSEQPGASAFGRALQQQEQQLSGTDSEHSRATIAISELPGQQNPLAHYLHYGEQLDIELRVNSAIAQGPKNAGPLNQQMLAIRALQQMQTIAPSYCKHFCRYLDALLWLKQQEPVGNATSKS